MKTTAQPGQAAPQSEAAISKLSTIGEVSRTYGVTHRALRLYEQRGLLKPIRIRNARLYDSIQTDRLQLILKCKQYGFTIIEIAEILETNATSKAPGDEVAMNQEMISSQIAHLEKQRSEIDSAINELRANCRRRFGPGCC